MAFSIRVGRTIILGAACAGALLAPATSAAPAAAPTLRATPATLEYGGGETVLTGVAPSKLAGESVSILSQACRFTEPAEIATVKTRAGGAFRFRVQPMLNTTFRVRWHGRVSKAVKIGVRPIVSLRRLAKSRYRIEISTTNPVFLDGKTVVLQRAVGKRWITVKRARLAKASAETAITVLSAATVRTSVKGTLRAKLPAAQAGCYLGATSSTVGP